MCVPNRDDATSLYRAMGPFGRLSKSMELSLVFPPEVSWSTVAMVDVMFLQRPFTANHVVMAERARSSRVPLWIDYDDDLFAVPPENPTYGVYSHESTQKQVAKICAMADVITVSTETLKEKLKRLNKNIIVVPNALDDWLLEKRLPRREPREQLVFWRGTSTHQKDLMEVSGELYEVATSEAAQKWSWQFMGYNPFWISERMGKNCIISDALDPLNYLQYLDKLSPALMVVPLTFNDFNRAKSNIAWLEGSYAGAAVIAPDMPEFRRPGCMTYKNSEEFQAILAMCIAGKYNLTEKNETSWNHIRRHLTLTQVNPLREQILKSLTSRKRGFVNHQDPIPELLPQAVNRSEGMTLE